MNLNKGTYKLVFSLCFESDHKLKASHSMNRIFPNSHKQNLAKRTPDLFVEFH